MPSPKSPHVPTGQPTILELPGGDRYHLHPQAADIEGYLAPDRVPRLKAGAAAIEIQVTQGGGAYTVRLAPDELKALLRHARLESEALGGRPPGPEAPHDPSRGRGRHDPAARRWGPTVDHAPDAGHRGPTRRRRKPYR
jgi:hypothetical protein